MGYPQITVALVLFLMSCSAPKQGTTPSAQGTSQPQVSDSEKLESDGIITEYTEAYRQAVRDAMQRDRSEISRNLTRLRGNPNLRDSIVNGEWHVLVAAWTPTRYHLPESGPCNTGKLNLWVTIAPQMQSRCRVYSSLFDSKEKVRIRLLQLLGLRPDYSGREIVEIWVKPDDLFRPCPDNETNDTECELEFPADVESDYRKWYGRLYEDLYPDDSEPGAYLPEFAWTGLGYTYDWNAENSSHVGLSQFVVHRESDVWIRGTFDTETYCSEDY